MTEKEDREHFPCPFCDEKPYWRVWENIAKKEVHLLKCVNPNCKIQPGTAVKDSTEACVTDWNTRATAKVDRDVLVKFITWVRNHWALNAMASNAEIVEYFLTYKSPLIRDNKEPLPNSGEEVE